MRLGDKVELLSDYCGYKICDVGTVIGLNPTTGVVRVVFGEDYTTSGIYVDIPVTLLKFISHNVFTGVPSNPSNYGECESDCGECDCNARQYNVSDKGYDPLHDYGDEDW